VSTKLPDDAFEKYVAMGPDRSYQALAKRLGVDKRSITRLAVKEKWIERLAKIQKDARAETDRKLVGDLQVVREQQLRELRFLRSESLKVMKGLPPEQAIRVAAALNVAWKHELLLLGDPTERSNNLRERIRGECDRWLIPDSKEPDSSSGDYLADDQEEQ